MSEADFAAIGNYALMLLPDQNIDRHNCKRVVPMEVLCLGMSRTGTLTMQKALSILGYPNPYHFSNIYGNVKDCDMWMEAYRAKYDGTGKFDKEQWDQLLGHCGAVTDTPCNDFAPELIAAYPQAKIVLVERDIDKWFKSFSELCNAIWHPSLTVLSFFDPWWHGRITEVGRDAWFRTQFRATNKQQTLDNAKLVYREHYARVRRLAKESDMPLLEYKLGQGWTPLCEFLGKPIPMTKDEGSGVATVVEFPHLNEQKSIQQVFVVMAKRSLINVMTNVAIIFGTVGAAVFGIWRARDRIAARL